MRPVSSAPSAPRRSVEQRGPALPLRALPIHISNKPPDIITTRPWPLTQVPAGTLQALQRTLQASHIDQTVVLALIDGGFGGSDLARCIAELLLARLQATDPVAADWQLLVLQALRDPRAVWEPAFIVDRARLHRHLQVHPGRLLQGLYLRLLRPWQIPPAQWRMTSAQPRRALPACGREQALQDLRAQWTDWLGGPLPDALLARCIARANRLNRQERGRWEPLVAVGPLRAHLHGRPGLPALLQRLHLVGDDATVRTQRALVARLLTLAAQACLDPAPPAPQAACAMQRRGRALASCSLLLLQPALPAIVALARGVTTAHAPWPVPSGTCAGALTAAGAPTPTMTSGAAGGVGATAAGPPVPPRRGGGGLRPEEALRTVAHGFTDAVCAHWLDIPGTTAADFNDGVHALLRSAPGSVNASAGVEDRVQAFLEQGDMWLAQSLQRAEVPLFTRLLLERSSRGTRIFLLVRALGRLYARIAPRNSADPAMRDAATWMLAFHDAFLGEVGSPAVQASVSVGDATRWLPAAATAVPAAEATIPPPPAPTPTSPSAATVLDKMNRTALGHALQSVLPGPAEVLDRVLAHVLGRRAFPDPADLEPTLQRLYSSDRSGTLIANVTGLPPGDVDDAARVAFFSQLARIPTRNDTHRERWQTQLQQRDGASVLRGDWIGRLAPAQAIALFANDVSGGLHALLEEATDVPAAANVSWHTRLQATARLTAWLHGTVGPQRMAALLRRPSTQGPAPCFLFAAQGLPAADALALLQGAVRHHLGDAEAATLAPMLARARRAALPLLSLAVDLQTRNPLLPASACMSHAAVLLAPQPAKPPVPVTPLRFPLPALPPNVTLPTVHLDVLLRDCGLPLLEQLDPDLPAWQAWELIAQTTAFAAAAQPLKALEGSVSDDAQATLARWLLEHSLGRDRLAAMTAALDDASARDRPMQATREALQAQLPASPLRTGRDLLWWLLVRHAGRPEWLVADLPEWLDYGRSLQGVSFLQAASLLDAAESGLTARLGYEDVVQLPARLATRAQDPEHSQAWLQALVRPALLYAHAHQQIATPPALANATDVSQALAFVRQQQAALARAAGQLARRAPQRRALAARQLRDAGIPPRYWNQTLADIPAEVLTRAGITRAPTREPSADPLAVAFQLTMQALEEAVARDSLQLLLVGGAYEITGQPSIGRLYEQAFALYRQQMTDAVAGLLARALEMLPAADLTLLRTTAVTPMRVPAGAYGVVLRCDADTPVYVAVIPSSGFAARLTQGDRFDGQQWRSGVLYDPRGFASGVVADQAAAEHLHLLDLAACHLATSLPAQADADARHARLLQASATLMHGDFFRRTREAELRQLTGMEALVAAEEAFADGLARFALPFYGCTRDVIAGDTGSALFDCTLDAAGLLLPGAGAGRFLRSTTSLVVRAGDISVGALLREAGSALLRLGQDIAAQSGLVLLRDLGRGAVRLSREGGAWLLEHVPGLQMSNALSSGVDLDRTLITNEDVIAASWSGTCPRARRQINVPALCTGETLTLFDYTAAPGYDTPGDVGWFAGMQVVSNEPVGDAGRAFLFDGEGWLQTRDGSGYRYVRDSARSAPVPRPRIRATLRGGEAQLVRIELHNPYPDHLSQVTQGAVIGRAPDGSRALITRVAPGRFYVAHLAPGVDPAAGLALALWPLENEGFTAAQNDAVKTAWWGAFHYSQQCRLSGADLVGAFGSQLQRQLEQLSDLEAALTEVRGGSPYQFDNLPAQMVMSCARSNCRYVQELRRQVGPSMWRAPRADDQWIDDALRDLLSPPGAAGSDATFTRLDDTLEARFLTPRRGPAKTLAMARLTVTGEPVPLVFHSTSGQRKGRSLLAIGNQQAAHAPAGWRIDGREVITPQARYIDAQPTAVSIASGEVARTVPNHSLHPQDLDGALSNERNARAYDAERNLYYRIERYIAAQQLDPAQVTGVRLFSSRPICASCHISVGSLRARFPGSRFEVIEREVARTGGVDTAPGGAP